MERDVSIEKTTAEVVESLLTSVCSRDCLVTNFDPGVQPQEKQSSASPTLQNFDSSISSQPIIDLQSVETEKKTTAQKIDYDVIQDPLQFHNNSLHKKYMATLPTCSTEGPYRMKNRSELCSKFPCKTNPLDECNEMIEKLLDSLDTELNKTDLVKPLSIDHSHGTVSDLTKPDQRQDCIEQVKVSTSNCYLRPAGISTHCSNTKVINDEIITCKSFPFSPSTSANENDNVFENCELEIDKMVNEIISNNVELLACCQTKRSKSTSHPALQFSHLAVDSQKKPAPSTPGCSDNLAGLELCSMESRSQKDPRISSHQSENTVPTGWLSTLSKRKRGTNPVISRERCRSDDFAYCGPLRESNNNENAGPITSCFTCLKLRQPEEATEIPAELLYSGAAVTPGVCDKNGYSLAIIFADDILWQKSQVGAISLARLLLYLTNRLFKISLILDCRNSTVDVLKTLLEAFSIFQNNSRIEVCQIYHLFTDDGSDLHTFQSVLKSLFRSELTRLQSVDDLTSYVEPAHLLQCYGGKLMFSQAEWTQNRLVVDPFVAFCGNVSRNFSRETVSMTSHPLPSTAKETRALLEQHQQDMTQLLDDRQITNLRDRSARILEQLANDVSVDAKSCTELVRSSFSAANEAITHFVRIADDRFISLEQHLLIKQFEQSCEYINHWYTSNMNILTDIFDEVPKSFDELRKQRAEFDAFYMTAMTDYAKCDCLLNEVEQLNELGYLREAELTQRAKLTEDQVKELVFMMEQKKEEIEVATHMYKFIDQAYSWALEGMKFVALLNMNECLSYDSCHKMIEEFDNYMKNHPTIPEGAFAEIQELGRRYGNKECLKQCDYAFQKCKETSELFQKRRDLITKLKSQFKSSNKKRSPFRLKGREKSESNVQDRIRSPASSAISSETEDKNRIKSSADEESVDNLSLNSFQSSGCDEFSEHIAPPSPSSAYIELNGLNYTSKGNPKPARKILKKSVSLPGHEMTARINNHHVHSKSGVPLVIGSPVQAEDELDSNGKTKVTLIIEELIATEKEYVKSLNYVIEHYFPEMCKLDIPQALRCKRNIIFGNIEKIAEFHSGYFLRDLENCNGNPLLVAKAFQSHKLSFGLYALYSKNKPQSDELLREHGNEFFKTKQIELEDKLDLASYLLKPVQRMGKYALLLHGMAKQCKLQEEKSLRDAEELVKFQLRHGNDLLTMDSIRECDVNLKEQGNLLRQDQFIIFSGRRKIIRRVFLFEELILFSKPILVHGGHDVYQYKGSYKTAEIGMTENIGDSGFKFEIWFRRRRLQSAQDTYTLQSTTRATKRAWVEEIRNLLWKQALHNKDYRRKEMSSMGVGSKPHLDLTFLSENSIIDRSVVATPPGDRSFIANRLPRGRTRVSIAVPSFEYVAQQSKRPHSTISTSSSTSSVGSGNNQSSSLVSSLALASWQTHSDAKLMAGFSPPVAYCDFHAIAEDLNEDCESSSDSSVATFQEETTDLTPKSPISRQYVTTV